MLQRLLCCAALVSALFAVRGFAQAPARCDRTTTLSQTFVSVIVELGEVNCFACSQAQSWTATNENALNVPVSDASPLQIGGVTVAEVEANHLVLPDPGAYVLPGSGGRRNIICIDSVGTSYEARLSSPELIAPLFFPASFNEFTPLAINCINSVPNDIGRVQIFNPAGEMVGFLSYNVPNVTREFAGIYSCVVTSQVSNATKTTTAEVIIRYAPEITPANVTSHEISLGEELRLACGYVGVPAPALQWVQNSSIILTNSSGVTVTGDEEGDTLLSIVIDAVGRDSGGTYTCRANNSLGVDQNDYTVLILIPPAPITNEMVTSVGEREIGLSWMTGFDGFTPITGVTVEIAPERGVIAETNRQVGIVNSTTIDQLLPFRSYDFVVRVENAVGASDPVTITASTLSLLLDVPQNVNLTAQTSTNIVLTWNPPLFAADTTDDPNFYIVEFSRVNNGLEARTENVSSSVPLRVDFRNLAKGTFYQASVTAYNDAGRGNTSMLVQEETLVDAPTMPTELMVEGVGAEVLRVSWGEPADNGGRPVSEYRVAIDSIGFSNSVGSEMREVLLRGIGLVENTTYLVAVSAANAAQGFGPSATEMGTTQSITLPQTIFDLPLPNDDLTTNMSAVFTWSNPGGTIDRYLVQYVLAVDGFAQGAVMSINVGGNDTSVAVTGLLPGSTYEFRVAVINSLGQSEFSVAGMVSTNDPDPPVITSSVESPVREGTNIMLNCTVTLEGATLRWTKDGEELPESNMFDVNFNSELRISFLRIIMPADGSADGTYTCTATAGSNTVSADFVLDVTPTEASDGIDQTVIIIVASVGGAALIVFIVVVVIAVCCLCVMKKKGTKGNYAMQLKDRKQNANWIETSTQFVPATGNQLAAEGASASDRLAFDYSVDLQTHSSFNTMEKQRVQAVDNQYVNVAPETNGREESPSYVNTPATVV